MHCKDSKAGGLGDHHMGMNKKKLNTENNYNAVVWRYCCDAYLCAQSKASEP